MGHLEHQPVQHILFLQLHKFNFKTGVTQHKQQSCCRMLLVVTVPKQCWYLNDCSGWFISHNAVSLSWDEQWPGGWPTQHIRWRQVSVNITLKWTFSLTITYWNMIGHGCIKSSMAMFSIYTSNQPQATKRTTRKTGGTTYQDRHLPALLHFPSVFGMPPLPTCLHGLCWGLGEHPPHISLPTALHKKPTPQQSDLFPHTFSNQWSWIILVDVLSKLHHRRRREKIFSYKSFK